MTDLKASQMLYSIPVASIIAYFNLTGEVISIYAWVVILDTILGMISKHRNGVKITSSLWSDWVTKKFTRLLIPFVFSAVCRGAGVEFEFITWAMTALMSLLIAGEWYSVMRHIYNINTKKDLPEIEVMDIVIQKITMIFRSKIDSTKPDL